MSDDDYEVADVWVETERTARKAYRCNECPKGISVIWPGDRYIEITHCVRGDGWWRDRVCMPCMALRREYAQLTCKTVPIGWVRSALEELGWDALDQLAVLDRPRI